MSAVLVAPLLLRGESALDAVFVVPEGAAARRSYASRHFETGAVHAPPATVVLRI
jgi:hypothetical protein